MRSVAVRCGVLTLATLAVDYAAAPILYTGSTLCAAVAWVVLATRQLPCEAHGHTSQYLLPPFERVVMFAALHGMLVAAATLFPQLEAWWPGLAVLSAAKASLKVLVLMPALILLPFGLWRTVWRHYRDVSIAAAVILLTFFPWRIFEFHWELQARLTGHAVFQISRWFIATLSLMPAAEPVLSGPELSVTVTQFCSPMAAVHTLQVLFGIAAVWEWNRWNKRRLAVAYFGGLLFMVGVNVMRISIMLITGNLLSASLVLDYHTAFSWAFYALTFSAYFFCIQPWLQNSTSATVEPAPAAAL